MRENLFFYGLPLNLFGQLLKIKQWVFLRDHLKLRILFFNLENAERRDAWDFKFRSKHFEAASRCNQFIIFGFKNLSAESFKVWAVPCGVFYLYVKTTQQCGVFSCHQQLAFLVTKQLFGFFICCFSSMSCLNSTLDNLL